MSFEGKKVGEYQGNFGNTFYEKSNVLYIQLDPEKKDVIKKQNYFVHFINSLLIYTCAFFVFYFLKNKTLRLEADNIKLLSVFLFSVISGSILSKKFNFIKHYEYGRTLGKQFLSLLITLAASIILFHLFEIRQKMTIYLLGALFSGLVIETFYFVMLGTKDKRQITFFRYKKLSFKYLTLDFLILLFFCSIGIGANIIPNKNIGGEFILLAIIFIIWISSAATTHRFLPSMFAESKWDAFELQVKFYLRFIVLVVLLILFLQLNFDSAVYFIRAILGYTLVSSILFMFIFAPRVENKTDGPTTRFLKDHKIQRSAIWSGGVLERLKYSFTGTGKNGSIIDKKLQLEYLKAHKDVFRVLDYMLDLNSFDLSKAIIIDSNGLKNDILQQPGYYQILVDLNVLNDQYNLNNYLRQIRKTLVQGGVFVGALLPHKYRYDRFIRKHSFWLGNILYFFDLIWKRVFPKLPFTREIYFKFRKEKDQAISLAEGLGRLVYTGYKIIDITTVEEAVYFVVVRDEKPTPEKKFFYSPIFKMKRMGKGGKPIYVYKLRTMYAYSEFIQDYVFEHNRLQPGGKFKDDFRIPGWGKLFRKLFIDELPMLMNWIKGDLKLVGVRPISDHYLSLYSEEHQERRKNFKPGLVPPFYADLPKTIKEIELSEKNYLDAYEKNPLKTDIKYLYRALINILLKKKRSA